MLSFSLFFFFVSIYLLFVLAKRIEFNKGNLSLYFNARPLLAKGLAVISLIIGFCFLYRKTGVTNALLLLLVVWPTFASLIVLFAPLYKPKKIIIFLSFCVLFSIETSLKLI
ncbi:hypothetical protein GCM10022397_02550 [Flavivirga jejuensis]